VGPPLRAAAAQAWRTVPSQLANAALFSALWSPRQLLRAAGLPLRRALSRDGVAGPPLAVAQYLTYACPEKCSFCDVTHAVEAWTKALSAADQAALVDRLAPQVGTWAVGGGEPMAYPHLVDHLGRLRRHGVRVFVVTSGAGADPARARALAAVEALTISVHGDAATHDALMGRAGAFDRALGLAADVRAQQGPRATLVLNAVLSPETAGTMGAVIAAGRAVGAHRVRFTLLSFLTPTERAASDRPMTVHTLAEGASAAWDVEATLAAVEAVEREHGDYIELQPKLSKDELRRWWAEGGGVERPCLSLWHTLFLRPDGSAVPCGHLFDDPLGDARTAPLDAVWQAPALRALRLTQPEAPLLACRRCCKV
jgi:MoaA/NifB/PqqE/SkfB family radical SAM enzyme